MTDQVGGRLWQKPDRTTMWLIVHMQFMSKKKLSSRDRSNWVGSVTKTKQVDDMIDRIDLVYTEIKTELQRPIWSGAICEENHIEKWCDQLYKYNLHQKQNWVVMTDWIKCHLWWKLYMLTMWLIGLGIDYDENQIGKNVTNHIDVGYVKNEIDLSWAIV